jgi:hypothetical protein
MQIIANRYQIISEIGETLDLLRGHLGEETFQMAWKLS